MRLETVPVVKELSRFCKSLGGEPNLTPFDFECIVDPEKVMEDRNWHEFLRLLERTKGAPISSIYFGKEGAYFYYRPDTAMGGFSLTKYVPKVLEDEEMDELENRVGSEFWEHMRSRGIEPDFHFIPDIDVGEWEGTKTYVDIRAEVFEPVMEDLKGIAKAMLEFKRKLNKLVKKY